MNNPRGAGPASVSPSGFAMTPRRALLALVVIVTVIATYLLLMSAIGLTEYWVSFLWLLYWAGMEQLQVQKLLPSLFGGAIGLSVALLFHALPPLVGTAGLVIALLLVVLLVFCQLMQWATVLVNNSTMLFLTAGTIPQLQSDPKSLQMYAALVLGCAYFGGLFYVVNAMWTRRHEWSTNR